MGRNTHHSYIQYATKEYNNKNLITNDFAYDKNGNMTMDLDRDIVTIQYNILNLPDLIQFKNGNQIVNKYDASGRKLSEEFYTLVSPLTVPLTAGQTINLSGQWGLYDFVTGNAFVDDKEYYTERDNQDNFIDLDKIYNAEGYIHPAAGTSMYYYFRKDHLGNNREVWYANTNTTVQRTQYYASGLPWMSNTGDNPSFQQRKYNGKEFIEMHGYDTYDIVWRQYYPAIGRFQTPDPFAEKYYYLSPYTMCAGNMVRYTDPDGRDWYINEKTGTLYYNKNQSDQTITYKKQQYTKVGDNNLMGKMGKTTEKNYNLKDSQKLANKNGFNINPVQEVQNKTTIKISDKDSPASTTSDQYKVVIEKYGLYSKSENNRVMISTEVLEVKKSFWENAAIAAMAIGGAAKFETTGRYYYTYVSNEELIKTGRKSDTYPWSAGDCVRFFGSWDDYSKATNGDGSLLNLEK